MKTGFESLENSVFTQDRTVYGDVDGNTIFGTIKLKRFKTSVDIISDSYVGLKTSEEGWFDLLLERQTGGSVLLHNAFIIGGPEFYQKAEKCRQKVFPNSIVFHADKLTPKHEIKRIGFQIERGEDFFAYTRLEMQYVGNLQGASKALLKKLRTQQNRKYRKENPKTSYDLTNPDTVYFQHKEADSIKFQALDMSFEIFTDARSEKGLGDNKTIKYDPKFYITFNQPVSIDHATDRVAIWHRYLNQIAYRRLSITEMSASGSDDPREGFADIYMSNEPRVKKRKHDRFHVYHSPFNRYHDREAFAEFLTRWFNLNVHRNRFRISLDHVINEKNNANDITKIGMLCSGIETLPLKGFRAPITKAQSKALATTTLRKSKRLKLPFDKSRIFGLIATLRRPGLKAYLEHIFNKASGIPKDDDRDAFIKQVIRLRNLAAHGSSSEDYNQPIAYPIQETLKALCVLYDLKTSNPEGEDFDVSKLIAKEFFDRAYMHFRAKLPR